MCIRGWVFARRRETESIHCHHQISLFILLIRFSPLLLIAGLLCYFLPPLFFFLFVSDSPLPLQFGSPQIFSWPPPPTSTSTNFSSTMALGLRKGFSAISNSGMAGLNDNRKLLAGAPPRSLVFPPSKKVEFRGDPMVLRDQQAGADGWVTRDHAVHTQAASFCVPPSMRWWEKGKATNMVEIESAQGLVNSLLDAGDRLVVVDFYSPGCGGCKSLHPKICQFAENNPDVLFLKVNYEEHKSMCTSLNVHVLPFFRFYRGARGRVCSFSCTNATIKKFKDALAKHAGGEVRDTRPAKGLEESELLKLASNGELRFLLPPICTAVGNPSGGFPVPAAALTGGRSFAEAAAERRMSAARNHNII